MIQQLETSEQEQQEPWWNAAFSLHLLMVSHKPSTTRHMHRVGALLSRLSGTLEVRGREAQMIVTAGWLHDIGKLAIPASILMKPGALTAEEWRVIKAHAAYGADIAWNIPHFRCLAPLIRAHHERWDGQGYPDGLAGETIPLGARMIAVVDAYTAMTEERSYRQAFSPEAAREELYRCAGTQFDPRVVEALACVLCEQFVNKIVPIVMHM